MGFRKISCLKNNQRDGGSREKVDCKTMSARRAEIKKVGYENLSFLKRYVYENLSSVKRFISYSNEKSFLWTVALHTTQKHISCPNCMHCVLCANCPEIQLSLHYREWFVLFRETIENVLVHIVQMITVVW